MNCDLPASTALVPRAPRRTSLRRASGLPAAAELPPQGNDGETATGSLPGSAVIVLVIMASAILADRAVIGLSTGGRGALGLLTFGAPAIALVAAARYGTARTLGFIRSPVFLLGVAPYLVLTLTLPILGVMFHAYPERTLIALTEATTALSFMVLGAALSRTGLRAWRSWLLAAIVVQLLYGLGQVIYLGRGPGWELFGPFHDWDLSLQSLYGTFVQARGTALYFNPNELGLWAGVAAILAWMILTPRLRAVGVTLALLTLLISQSRGASVALLAAAIVGVFLAIVRGRMSTAGAARAALSVGLAIAVAVVVVIALEPSRGLVDRFGALFAVWSDGPRADPNLAGRLDYWASVLDLSVRYPWGTWGPPELLLGSAVDSSWFRVFAQGSVVYVGALALLLVAPFVLRATRFGGALMLIAVLIAVAGLTQTPPGYPVIYLFWALLGAGLQSSVSDRATASVRPARAVGRGAHRGPAYDHRTLPPRRPGLWAPSPRGSDPA